MTGLVVPVGDAGALAGGVLELLRDPWLAARMGSAARRRAAERFTREAVLAAYEAGYEELAGGAAASAGA